MVIKEKSVFSGVPAPYNKMPMFMQLFLIKLFRPQHLIKALKEYVSLVIGPEYAESPPSSLEILYSMSDKTTPIVFILSQSADPNE